MASASRENSLPSLPGQSRDSECGERLARLPELQSSAVLPRLPAHVIDPEAVLKRRIKRKHPSEEHLKARELMFSPGWYTPLRSPQQKEQLHRRHKRLPVNLPPLESTEKLSQKLVSTPNLPRWPCSLRNIKLNELYEYNKDNYLFIDDEYVTSVREGKYDMVTRDRWEEEYNIYCKLMRIPFFALYKKWKPLYVWHTKVRARKIRLAKDSIETRSCFFSPSLSPALMDIRKMCCQISDMSLCLMEKEHTYTLQEFQSTQFGQLQEVLNNLGRFQDLVKEVTICACRHYLESGKTDSLIANPMTVLKFTDMRERKSRLICFIRLVDYLVVNSLHSLVVYAVHKLLAVLEEHIGQTPSHAIIQSWSHHSADASDPVEKKMNKKSAESKAACVHPVFMSELMLDTNALTYKPSEEDFQEAVAEMIRGFESIVMSVQTLTSDPAFESVTELESFEDPLDKYENGPSVEFIVENDGHLQSMIQNIKKSLHFAFDAAKVYSHTFECFRISYKENESLDLDAMQKQDHDVSFFETSLELHHRVHKEVLGVQQKRNLGLVLVDKTQLKDKLVSSSSRCLEVIKDMLTLQAKRQLDAVIAAIHDAKKKLELCPSGTDDLANSLTFLDEIQERILLLEEEHETVCKMYNLITLYSIATPADDLAGFARLQPSIESLHIIIDEAVGKRDSTMDKFCSSMLTDIKKLQDEVIKIEHKSQAPQILDINADSSEVRLRLEEIQISIDELQAQASTYTSYQKKFKLEMTKFDTLEKLTADFRLKQLLWDSMEEWDSLQYGWWQSTLMQLDMEQFSSQINKYGKLVNQLEKGLPPNSLVPNLKDKVDVMKQRLAVVTDLRNPCMKPEHWKTLESVVGTSLVLEELTVPALEELNVFLYGAEIQEISGQASGEASVEIVISKVEDVWRTTEFTVLSHGASKEAFILGGTDDIQVLLDDSIINVGTVASSRYVAPIKLRVEKLLHQLNLFNQTLEEWLTCQRNWLYLESIFLAPDIKRQLPTESKMFVKVDKSWKDIMTKVNKMPNAFKAATRPDLLVTFQNNNALLDEIQKCLEAYLESKRVIFPRFYFLSNDELLKILAQTRNPQAVQPHLRKCFDAITRLEFALLPAQSPGATGMAYAGEQETIYSKDILNMVSPEGEKVKFEWS